MPNEASRHKRAWVGFVARDDVWGLNKTDEIKRYLVNLAKTIAKYEPVSILVSSNDSDELVGLLESIKSHNYPIELHKIEIYDLWIIDTRPIFLV